MSKKLPDFVAGMAAFRPPEEEVPWSEVPLYGIVRMSDDTGWYVLDKRDDGGVTLRRIYGGDKWSGVPPEDKPAKLVHQHHAMYTKPWAFIGVPSGTDALLSHLKMMHGMYVTTTTHWKTLGRLHVMDHHTLNGGNGWTPHIHVVKKGRTP